MLHLFCLTGVLSQQEALCTPEGGSGLEDSNTFSLSYQTACSSCSGHGSWLTSPFFRGIDHESETGFTPISQGSSLHVFK